MHETVIGLNRHHQKVEMPINSLIFRPCVYGILIEDDNVLLLPGVGGYDLPGGGISLGERMATALEREIEEETGYNVEVQRFVECADTFYTFDGNENWHSIMLYAVCKRRDKTQKVQHLDYGEKDVAQIGKPEWVPLKNLDSLKINTTVDFRDVVKRVYESSNL